MPRKKGTPKTGGRRKGTPNKTTASMKAAFFEVFEKLGGVDALMKWAAANPTDFRKFYARLLPHEVSGPDGSEIPFRKKVSNQELARRIVYHLNKHQ